VLEPRVIEGVGVGVSAAAEAAPDHVAVRVAAPEAAEETDVVAVGEAAIEVTAVGAEEAVPVPAALPDAVAVASAVTLPDTEAVAAEDAEAVPASLAVPDMLPLAEPVAVGGGAPDTVPVVETVGAADAVVVVDPIVDGDGAAEAVVVENPLAELLPERVPAPAVGLGEGAPEELKDALTDREPVALPLALGAPVGEGVPTALMEGDAEPVRQGGSGASCGEVHKKGAPTPPLPQTNRGEPEAIIPSGQPKDSACPPSSGGEGAPPPHATLAVKRPHCAFAPVPNKSTPTPNEATSRSAGSVATRVARTAPPPDAPARSVTVSVLPATVAESK